MDIGKKIKEIRTEHGLSQEQFANQFSVTWQTVSNWENGKNYPDLSVLTQLSDIYGITLDTLLKNDVEYVHGIDASKKKANGRKKIILILLLIICILLAWGIYGLIHLGDGTDNGQRVLSETDVKMWVNLPDETPSRAIARTFDADAFRQMSERDREYQELEVLGHIEGDIPAVHLNEHPYVQLIFQDNAWYLNQTIEENAKVTAKLYGEDPNKPIEKQIDFTYKDGGIYFQFEPDFVEFNEDFDIWYQCVLTAEYTIKGKDYVSLTAFSIFEDDIIEW